MWNSRLVQDEWKCISFNSWENDFLEDPLVCLMGELSQEFETENSPYIPSWKGVKDAAAFLIKKSVPGVVKHITVGAVDFDGIGEIVGDAAKDATEKAIESHETLKQSLRKFKTKLCELAKKVKEETGKPLLVVVDELDRCRPNFALEMLEAIKHLFEVENVVFVLAYDGDQLACSTQAIYGNQFDGKGYLQRFFNIELQLPNQPDVFLNNEAKRMGLDGWVKVTSGHRHCGTGSELMSCLAALAIVHQFDLRTLQRILTRVSIAVTALGTDNHIYSSVFAPLTVLSVVNPKLLNRFFSAKTKATDLVTEIWPVESMHRLFPHSRASSSDSALSWAYVSSMFFLLYVDHIEQYQTSKEGEFKNVVKSVIESRKLYPGKERLESGFAHLLNDHSLNYWNANAKEFLCGLIDGSSDLFCRS